MHARSHCWLPLAAAAPVCTCLKDPYRQPSAIDSCWPALPFCASRLGYQRAEHGLWGTVGFPSRRLPGSSGLATAKLVEQVAMARRASAPVLSAVLKATPLKDALLQTAMQSEQAELLLQAAGHKLANALAALGLVVAPLAGKLLRPASHWLPSASKPCACGRAAAVAGFDSQWLASLKVCYHLPAAWQALRAYSRAKEGKRQQQARAARAHPASSGRRRQQQKQRQQPAGEQKPAHGAGQAAQQRGQSRTSSPASAAATAAGSSGDRVSSHWAAPAPVPSLSSPGTRSSSRQGGSDEQSAAAAPSSPQHTAAAATEAPEVLPTPAKAGTSERPAMRRRKKQQAAVAAALAQPAAEQPEASSPAAAGQLDVTQQQPAAPADAAGITISSSSSGRQGLVSAPPSAPPQPAGAQPAAQEAAQAASGTNTPTPAGSSSATAGPAGSGSTPAAGASDAGSPCCTIATWHSAAPAAHGCPAPASNCRRAGGGCAKHPSARGCRQQWTAARGQ